MKTRTRTRTRTRRLIVEIDITDIHEGGEFDHEEVCLRLYPDHHTHESPAQPLLVVYGDDTQEAMTRAARNMPQVVSVLDHDAKHDEEDF